MKRTTHSLEETYQFAEALAQTLLRQYAGRDKALIVGLTGNLGSGKTTLVQGIARALGVTESVTSPTFVIQKKYSITKGKGFTNLFHIDAYRLESGEELKVLNWNDIAQNSNAIIVVEWPERVSSVFPDDAITIKCLYVDNHTRTFTVVGF